MSSFAAASATAHATRQGIGRRRRGVPACGVFTARATPSCDWRPEGLERDAQDRADAPPRRDVPVITNNILQTSDARQSGAFQEARRQQLSSPAGTSGFEPSAATIGAPLGSSKVLTPIDAIWRNRAAHQGARSGAPVGPARPQFGSHGLPIHAGQAVPPPPTRSTRTACPSEHMTLCFDQAPPMMAAALAPARRVELCDGRSRAEPITATWRTSTRRRARTCTR